MIKLIHLLEIYLYNMAKSTEMIKLSTIIEGKLYTPILYRKKSNGKTQHWQGVAYTDGDISRFLPTESHKFGITTNLHGWYYTKYGQEGGKTVETVHTEVSEYTNKGRSNEISPVMNAVNQLDTVYNKKIKEGYSTSIQDFSKSLAELIKVEKHRVFLEKIRDFNDYVDKVKYPMYIQRKLNGTTLCIVYHPLLNRPLHTDCYLRGRTTFNNSLQIVTELIDKLQQYAGLHIVGELYMHGAYLEDISGLARLEDPSNSELEFWIFDCFDIEKPDWKFKDRITYLHNMLKGTNTKICKLVDTYQVNNKEEVDKYYNFFISEKYEGAIIRNPNGENKFSFDKYQRSKDSFKLKPVYDMEATIIGYEQGKGKDKGLIKFVCKVDDKGQVTVRPSMSDIERKKLYDIMPQVFDSHYKGKLYKIQYAYLSKTGLPQQPVGIGLRDPSTL